MTFVIYSLHWFKLQYKLDIWVKLFKLAFEVNLKMTPNSTELSQYKEPMEQPKPPVKENYRWHICQTSFSMIGRICIGIIVGVCIAFSFRNEEPFDSTNVHIILCVIGVSTIFIYLNSYSICHNNRTFFFYNSWKGGEWQMGHKHSRYFLRYKTNTTCTFNLLI